MGEIIAKTRNYKELAALLGISERQFHRRLDALEPKACALIKSEYLVNTELGDCVTSVLRHLHTIRAVVGRFDPEFKVWCDNARVQVTNWAYTMARLEYQYRQQMEQCAGRPPTPPRDYDAEDRARHVKTWKEEMARIEECFRTGENPFHNGNNHTCKMLGLEYWPPDHLADDDEEKSEDE